MYISYLDGDNIRIQSRDLLYIDTFWTKKLITHNSCDLDELFELKKRLHLGVYVLIFDFTVTS